MQFLIPIITTLLVGEPMPAIPVELLARSGFDLLPDYTSKSGDSVTFQRARDRVSLLLTISAPQYRNPEGDFSNQPPVAARMGYEPGVIVSGLPLGGDTWCKVEDKGFYIYTTTHWDRVMLIASPPYGTSPKGFVLINPKDWTADKPLFERVARVTLANLAGSRLGASYSSALNGATVPTRKCGRSSAIFGEVNTWANRRGWSVEENTEFGYFTLKKGARYVVLPLGSPKVKVDGVWRDAGDVVALRDGKLYATKRAIEAIE